jgi:hypothetical protein
LQAASEREGVAVAVRPEGGGIEVDVAGGRGFESHNCPGEGGLAATGFADESDGFPGVDVEGDAVDGADVADGAGEDAAPDGVPGFQVVDVEEGGHGGGCMSDFRFKISEARKQAE